METSLYLLSREIEKLEASVRYWRQRAKEAEKERSDWIDLAMKGEQLRASQMLATLLQVTEGK